MASKLASGLYYALKPLDENKLISLILKYQDKNGRLFAILVSELCRLQNKTEQTYSFLISLFERLSSSKIYAVNHHRDYESIKLSLVTALSESGSLYVLRFLERHLPVITVPDSVVRLAMELSSPSEFFEKYCHSYMYQSLRRTILVKLDQSPSFVLDERWVDFFAEYGDGLLVIRTANASRQKAKMFLSLFKTGKTGSQRKEILLVFGLYPVALMNLQSFDFWEEYLFRMECVMTEQWLESREVSMTFADKSIIKILSLNIDYTIPALIKLQRKLKGCNVIPLMISRINKSICGIIR